MSSRYSEIQRKFLTRENNFALCSCLVSNNMLQKNVILQVLIIFYSSSDQSLHIQCIGFKM